MAAPMRLAFFILAVMAYSSTGKSVNNPADALSNEINKNLTASKLPKLYSNPGLGCMALQYIQAYQGQCSEVGSNGQKPPEDSFKSAFADNCGVDPASVTDITGTVLACETEYRDASYAFHNLLFKGKTTLSTLQSNNQTEFGVGISGYEGGAPYFWCVLFSSGAPNASFTFADQKAKFQKTGCFSGTGKPCSASISSSSFSVILLAISFLLSIAA